jgi:chromosome segregation ATPase
MKTRILGPVVLSLVVLAAAISSQAQVARADTETDRLREALRTATVQLRQLEDQRAALQAKVADADREKAAAKAQVDAAKAEVRQTEKQYREAVDEFNKRLAERDTTLEKWKTAYEEAATVARDKDAARAKFEGEAAAYKASTKSCVDKNGQLIKAGHDLLQRYETLTVGDIIVVHEPMLGLRRVEIQNAIQDIKDKILDQKAVP